MPRQQSSNVPAERGTALTIPDDIREDLLRSQIDQIDTQLRLPRVKIMAAGACLYEFSDTLDTVREFRGVVLNSHPRNVLWDRPYGEGGDNDEDRAPACMSDDGRHGTPRPGFAHVALGGPEALGNELIECRSCPYNQWRSKELIGQAGKGKACTNQKAVYVAVEDREQPVELILPPTSLPIFDEYLASLAGRGIPVQAIVTIFRQERRERGSMRWAVASFTEGEPLDAESFEAVLDKRVRYRAAITPPDPMESQSPAPIGGTDDSSAPGEDDDDMPF